MPRTPISAINAVSFFPVVNELFQCSLNVIVINSKRASNLVKVSVSPHKKKCPKFLLFLLELFDFSSQTVSEMISHFSRMQSVTSSLSQGSKAYIMHEAP